ncbi:hypothetical protein D3C75_848310 [compost metagenome]
MGSHYNICALAVQLLKNGNGQRKAFPRVRASRQLINQQQYTLPSISQHPLNTLHLRRKGAQGLGQTLPVADYADDICEYCEVAAFLYRNQQTGLDH